MAIPESQLETWSHQGATASSARAYGSVQAAISSGSALAARSVDVFLQGSYRNDTNIRGDSDVDVVVQSDATFFYNLDRLSEPVRSRVKASFTPATYSWASFRQDVLNALKDHYGTARIVDHNKCITVASAGGTGIAADVVPAFTHRLYVEGSSGPYYLEGIAFETQRDGHRVVNFPKKHYERGVEKSRSTGGEFKPIVRVFKNARSHLVDARMLSAETAPSFFVECMIFNVSDNEFQAATWQDQFSRVFNSLQNAELNSFMCQNGVLALFGPSPDRWNLEDAREYLRQMYELWRTW